MVLTRHELDPQRLIGEGVWRGEILHAPRGSSGFGCDPLFFDPQLGKTSAELSTARKNRISHRGKALRRLLTALRESG